MEYFPINVKTLVPSQAMTGGVDENAKELLNLSDCMDFCQVPTFQKREKNHKNMLSFSFI